MSVRVQREDFDLGAEVMALRAGRPAVGAVASFIGTVRDVSEGSAVGAMELEHYPGMTEKALMQIEAAACARWELLGVTIIHRVGPLQPQDQIVMVAVASAHRGNAFAACEFIMDYLKSEAPFWKKEETPEGARWVDARVTDDAALKRWGIPSFNASGPDAGGDGEA
ncbi:molybdenum cofactor biosynthesis protein MoaE [Cupriavidus basilensis]